MMKETENLLGDLNLLIELHKANGAIERCYVSAVLAMLLVSVTCIMMLNDTPELPCGAQTDLSHVLWAVPDNALDWFHIHRMPLTVGGRS